MRYSEAKTGRTFVIRLEQGEILHEKVEEFAASQSVSAATLIVLGGADRGSRLIVGPENGSARPVSPMEHALGDVHEVAGVGTLFPDDGKKPVLHMHVSSGRKNKSVTGCVRRGVKVWQVMEIVLTELIGSRARRGLDPETGFHLLNP